VLPFFELDLVRSWYGPIGDHIRRESGLELRLAWKPTFADFLRAASRHDFDLVIAPTYTAPILSREFGLVPLGKTGVRPQTVLFVRRESTTSDIQQLRGRRIATPHRLATVSVLARHRLALEGLREGESVEFVDLESHSDVAMHVLEGRSAAGVAMSLALERLSPVLRSAIRELGRVGEYLDPILLASPELGDARAPALRSAFFSFGRTPDTAPLLDDPLYAPFELLGAGELERIQSTYAFAYGELRAALGPATVERGERSRPGAEMDAP
jgi:hypothetical protein